VIRPFGLNDMWLVRRLQGSGVSLAIEHALTHPRSPLWIALTAPWPYAGVGVATYVLDERGASAQVADAVDGELPGRAVGFVQLMKRSSRPEADLLYIAPGILDEPPVLDPVSCDEAAAGAATNGHDRSPAGVEGIWRHPLCPRATAAPGHGIQRIFASLPEEGPGQSSLRETGYSLYARETVYRLARVAPGGQAWPPGLRSQLPQDSWALQRLYARGTPKLVQQAEGALVSEAGAPSMSWWEPDRWVGVVWEPAGEVRGAVQVHVGRSGHWMRLWGASALTAREMRTLVDAGLGVLAAARTRRGAAQPVYITVRDYEIGLAGTLTGFGFAPFTDRLRYVKHATATVRELATAPFNVRETRQEIPARIR